MTRWLTRLEQTARWSCVGLIALVAGERAWDWLWTYGWLPMHVAISEAATAQIRLVGLFLPVFVSWWFGALVLRLVPRVAVGWLNGGWSPQVIGRASGRTLRASGRTLGRFFLGAVRRTGAGWRHIVTEWRAGREGQ